MKKQIKSRSRVADHGEVFTADREVSNMLDLVLQETERIDSRFLEPACGDGNFLIKILERKLDIVEKKYKKSQLDFERYSFVAISSLYGVDIMQDNVEECIERLYSFFNDVYTRIYKKKVKEDFRNVIRYILKKNILCGDALTMLKNDGDPIIFAEWSIYSGSMIKRRDYTLNELLKPRDNELVSDLNENVALPIAIKDYPAINFMRVVEYE